MYFGKRLFLLLLLALMINVRGSDQSPSRNILILTSYHMTHPWTSRLTNSIIKNAKISGTHLEFIVVELNAMRLQDPDAWNKTVELHLDNIRSGKYDMIVTLDDVALQTLLNHEKELPVELPIVFSGVELYTPDLQKRHSNMTGVVQNFNTPETVNTAMRLFPSTRTVVILSDSSAPSQKFAEYAKKNLPSLPGIKYLHIDNADLDLQKTFRMLADLPDDFIVITSPWRGLHINGYQNLGTFSAELASVCRKPYFASVDAMVGYGALGGYITLAEEHGRETAELICTVMNRGGAENIPVVQGKVQPVFDYDVLARHNLDMDELPPGSIIENEPPGLWETHHNLMLAGGGVFFLLLSLSFGLTGYVVASRRTMKRNKALYRALPGRIGVLNRHEKVLQLSVESKSEKDVLNAKTLRDIPNIDYSKLSEAFAGVFQSGRKTTLDYEYGATKRFMTIAPLEHHIFGEDAVIWFSHDNAELQEARSQAQDYAAKLKKNTRMWDILINSLPIHIFAKDAGNEFRYVFSNQAQSDFFNLPASELNGKNDFDLMPPELAERLKHEDEFNMANIDKSEESFVDLKDRSGRTHRMRAVQTPFVDEDGTHLLLGAMMDVTEIEESRRKLEEEKELRDAMIQFLPFMFFAKNIDDDFRYVMSNQAFGTFFNISPDSLYGKRTDEIFSIPAEAAARQKEDRQVIGSGRCLEFLEDMTDCNGKVHRMKTSKVLFRGRNGRNLLLGASCDITDLHDALSEFRRLNEEQQDLLAQHTILLDNMNAYVFTKDIDHEFRFTSCNSFCSKLMGVPREEILGKCDHELFPDVKEADAFLAADKEGAEKGETECVLPYTGVDGRRRTGKFFRKRLALSRNRNWLFMMVVDITDQEDMKRRAEDNAEQLRLTLCSIGDGVISTDNTGNIVMLNPVAERMIGVKEKEVQGLPHEQVFKIVGAYDNEPIQSPVTRTLRTGTIVELANHTDLISRDGRRYHIADSAAPILDGGRNVMGAILVFRDVTEEYISRDRLRNLVTTLEYASELTNSAAFSFDPSTQQMTGTKILPQLWPMDAADKALSLDQWIIPEDWKKLEARWIKHYGGEQDTEVFDFRAEKDGKIHYYRLKSTLDRTNPSRHQFIGVIQDITEITESARNLKHTTELWEQVSNTLPIMFFVKDADHDFRYILCNQAFSDFYGIPQNQAIGRTDVEIGGEAMIKAHQDDLVTLASNELCNFELRVNDCSGNPHLLKVVKKVFTGVDGRRLLFGASSDITELDNLIQNEEVVKQSLSDVMLEVTFDGAFKRITATLSSLLNCDRIILARCDQDGNLHFHDEWHSENLIDLKSIRYENHETAWNRHLKLFQAGELLEFNDFRQSGLDQKYSLSEKDYDVPQSLIASPIRIGEKLWGVLFVSFTKSKRSFSASDKQLMCSMSDIIALAQVRENQQQEITKRNKEKQTILDNISIPIWLHDGKGNLISANTAVEKIAGIPLNQLDTKRNRMIFNAGLPEGSELPVDVVVRTHQASHRTVNYLGRDYMLYLHPVLNETGELVNIIKSAIDVTELNALVQTQKLISYSLETFFTEPDAEHALSAVIKAICEYMKASRCFVMKFDSDTCKADIINEYASNGCPRYFDEVIHFPFNAGEAWYHAFSEKQLISWADTHASGAEAFFGGWFPIVRRMKSLHVSGIYLNGKFWGDIGIGYDDRHYEFNDREKDFIRTIGRMLELLLERKRAQEQLLAALKQAQAADKAKSFFIASVSHEIRTPLNAVIGLAELLQAGDTTQEEQKDYLNSIAYSGNALLQLINDVLDLSKLEADQMKIVKEQTNFEELAVEIKQIFKFRALENKLDVKLEIPVLPELELDKLRIRQILFNLMGNAVKFTKNGSVTIWAKYMSEDQDTGTFVFGVTDTGIGISETDQKKLMEPFVQVSKLRGTNAANNGTGLGLSICKRLAEKMDGTLQIESAVGSGSNFFVTLYHAKSWRHNVDEPEMNAEAGSFLKLQHNLSLLLVDDVDLNLKVMKAMCAKMGIARITCAKSGAEALSTLENNAFDLILTDMWMPGMTGAELAKKIHERKLTADIPIFAVTADVEAQSNFALNDFSGVLLKPVTMDKINKMLNIAVNSGGGQAVTL